MTSQTFVIGDTVRLRSGGPKMTVTAVGESLGTPTVWCSWFVGTKEDKGTFPPGALDKY